MPTATQEKEQQAKVTLTDVFGSHLRFSCLSILREKSNPYRLLLSRSSKTGLHWSLPGLGIKSGLPETVSGPGAGACPDGFQTCYTYLFLPLLSISGGCSGSPNHPPCHRDDRAGKPQLIHPYRHLFILHLLSINPDPKLSDH